MKANSSNSAGWGLLIDVNSVGKIAFRRNFNPERQRRKKWARKRNGERWVTSHWSHFHFWKGCRNSAFMVNALILVQGSLMKSSSVPWSFLASLVSEDGRHLCLAGAARDWKMFHRLGSFWIGNGWSEFFFKMIRNLRIFKGFHHLYSFVLSFLRVGVLFWWIQGWKWLPWSAIYQCTNHNLIDCQARVEALEARVQELEAEQELHELRAIVEAQEACACARNVSFFRHVFYCRAWTGARVRLWVCRQTKPLSFTKQMFAIVCSVKITRLEAALTEQRRIIESQSFLLSLIQLKQTRLSDQRFWAWIPSDTMPS